MQITPYENSKNDPSYLGYTQAPGPIPGNKTVESFLDGLANVGSLYVKGVDTWNKIRIDRDAEQGVNTLRNDDIEAGKDLLYNLKSLGDPQVSQAPGAPIANGAAPTTIAANIQGIAKGDPDNLPTPITLGLKQQQKLDQALKQGKVDEISYYGQAQQLSQNLISRYPGYSEYITKQISGMLGVDPANAQRHLLNQSLSQLLSSRADKTDQWGKEVVAMGPYLGEQATNNAFYETDPVKQNNLRAHVAGIKYKEALQDRDTKIINARRAENSLTEDMALNHASKTANNVVQSMIETGYFVSGGFSGKFEDTQKALLKFAEAGNIIDPKSKAELGGHIGQMRDAATKAVWDSLKAYSMNPLYKDGKPVYALDGNPVYRDSVMSSIKNQEELSKIVKMAMIPYDLMEQQIGSDNTRAATATGMIVKNVREFAGSQIAMNEDLQKFMGADFALGATASALVSSANVQSTFSFITEGGRAIQTMKMYKIFGSEPGEAPGLMDGLRQWKARANGPGAGAYGQAEPTPAELQSDTNLLRTIVTEPGAPLPLKIKTALVMADPQTIEYMNALKPEHQFNAFATLYDRQVSREIKGTMPDTVWQKYKSTGNETFKRLFKTAMDDTNKAFEEGTLRNVRWDPDTQQVLYDPALEGKATGRFGPQRVQVPAETAVNRLNTGLRAIGSMLEQDGQKITPSYLNSIGIDLNHKTPDQGPQQATKAEILKTLRNIPVKGEPIQKREAAPTPAPAPINRGPSPAGNGPQILPLSMKDELMKTAVKGDDGEHYVQRDGQWYHMSFS